MKWLLTALILPALTTSPAHARRSRARARRSFASVSAKLNKVGACAPVKGAPQVWIVKQWHLAATVFTKNFKEKYPQERNQTTVYLALADAIKHKKLQMVVAEGCADGEINAEFKTAYNGWTYEDLHKIAQTRGYDKIITHIPLKLEARFGDEVTTLCGDDAKLIEEGNLRLSNLRGWMGFWTRMHESYIDDKLKMYSDAAADLLKVPKTTPTKDILAKIHERMTDEMVEFKKTLSARNESFVKTLKTAAFDTAAVVISGLHVDDLKAKLEAANLNCQVLEPPGYVKEDEQLVDSFEKALRTNTPPKPL